MVWFPSGMDTQMDTRCVGQSSLSRLFYFGERVALIAREGRAGWALRFSRTLICAGLIRITSPERQITAGTPARLCRSNASLTASRMARSIVFPSSRRSRIVGGCLPFIVPTPQ